ncbi:MAG TPA: MMPL family transporter [Blastocatellia bacterium]|nr:MMPL family transporter [Blastocatellia bacterium]
MIQPAKFVVHNPNTIIVATLALTLAFLAAILIRGITFNGSPETLARKDETFRFYNETRRIFGDDRVIVVGITTSDVFTTTFLDRLSRLTSELAEVAGVDQALSLTNIKAIRREGGAIRVERLIDPRDLDQNDPAKLEALKQEVINDPLYVRHYISTDGKTASVEVFLKPLDEAETRAVADQVERVARSTVNGDEVFLSGVPVVDARGIRSMLRDMLVLSPIAALLCLGVFLFTFRSFWGAALPMSALVIGLIWTIGLMSLAGRPITLATLSLPTTLMAVGSSYIFHVLNQYRISMSSLRSKRRAWLNGLTFIGPAVIVSGTATMAGFGALASSAVPTARDMGIFEAFGVFAMLVLTVAFIPAALSLLRRDALGRVDSSRKDYATWLNRSLSNITAVVLFRKREVLVATFVATAAIGAGAIWLQVNTDYLHIFPRGSQTVRDAEKLHESLAGAATVQLVVSGAGGAVSDPNFLIATSKLEQFATSQPGVDTAISIADIVARINSVLPGPPDQMAAAIPNDRARLASIIRDYLSEDESLARLVSGDGSRVMIVLRVNLFSSNELRVLTRRIGEWAEQNLPAGIGVRATGSIILLNDASDAVAASQSSSLAIALVTIYLMMVVLFRSFATGLLALIPNLLPIICYFGILGWSGTPLDITTSLVASAVLGLAVDNAVHMIRRYRQCAAERSDEGWTMWLTMLRTGKPMVLANVMLIAAFLIFVLSSFVPVRVAGLLWASTIAGCLAADLVFLPVLMKTKLFARAALGE